jgi:hypothetical protein
MLSNHDRLILSAEGAGVFPVSFVSDSSTRVQDVFSISRDLIHDLYAWSRFERDSPAQQLAFMVEAHRLAAAVQAELGLGVTVFCLEDSSGGYRAERSRVERSEDRAWAQLPLEDRRQRFPRVTSSRLSVAESVSVPKVEPDDEGVVGKRVRIMEEWTVDFPVWGADHATRYGWVGLLDASMLPVGKELIRRFREWNQEWESWFPSVVNDSRDADPDSDSDSADGGGDPVIAYDVRLGHFVEGHILASDLQAACGPELFVVFP